MNRLDVVRAWDRAHPGSIHPARAISEEAYAETGRVQAELLASVLPRKGRVVDFGCGDGRVLRPLRELGFDVTGVDSSAAMLSSVPAPTLQSDGSDLAELLGRKVSGIYCLAVLIHHGFEDGEALVGDMAAALKPGGVLVLDWPVADYPVERRTWIEVTEWARADQDRIAADLGLERIDGPWACFRKT